MPFESRGALDSSQAGDPWKADITLSASLAEESLLTWYSGGAPLPLQARAPGEIYRVSDVTEVTSGADLAEEACSPGNALVTPTAREALEPHDSGGAGHAGEPRGAGHTGDSSVSFDSFDLAGSPGQPWDSRQPRDTWHSRKAFQAQVPFQSHGAFVSLLSFDVFHPWLDEGGRSWGPGVSSAAFHTRLTSQALQPWNSEKPCLSFDSWEPRSALEAEHAFKAVHPGGAPGPFQSRGTGHSRHSFKSGVSRVTSLSLLSRVTSVPRAAFHAHGARDAGVPRLSSVSRQTLKAGGARGPQGPLPTRRSWEAVLSWWPWQSWLA